jgi:hypothetical protein
VTYPPPLRPKRRFGVKWIVLTIVAVVVVCGGGIGAGVFLLLRGVSEAPRNATNAFADDLEAKDWAGAYDKLCGDTRSAFTPDQFTQFAQSRGDVRDHAITNFSVSNTNGRQTATINVSFEKADGSEESRRIPLLKEGEDWKICGQPY